MVVHSFRVSKVCSEAAPFIAASIHRKASSRVYANKHASTLTHAKNDIFVSAHKEKRRINYAQTEQLSLTLPGDVKEKWPCNRVSSENTAIWF